MPESLGVHIIGCGFGESIILTFPNGKVGVIDCCSPSLKAENAAQRLEANPTLRFLRQRLKVDRLAFVALTHPHEDHGRGLSHILIEFQDRIDEIWIFDAFQDLGVDRYFRAVLNDSRTLPIEEFLNEEPGTFSLELLTVRNLVLRQISTSNPARANARLFSGQKSVSFGAESVIIHFLGPSVALAQEYKRHLQKNLEGLVDTEGRVINKKWKQDAVNHNMASPAFLVEYGNTRIILGGDMEQDGWNEAIREISQEGSSLRCHFVKISHHGSTTGYTADLYRHFGESSRPLAVLTPFNRHRSPLPELDGVEHLLANCSEVWATSIEAAEKSLGVMPPLTSPELALFSSTLKRWRKMATERPEIWGAFDPNVIKVPRFRARAVAVPAEWLPDLKSHPRLAAVIHPRLRQAYLPTPSKLAPIEEKYRLSFYFDDTGNEVASMRYVGSGCGRLHA